jgi:restriction system protein
MTIPNYQEFMEPVLKVLSANEVKRKKDIVEEVADLVGLTAEQKLEMLDSGRAPVYKSRAGWAIAYLKQANAIETPKRAHYHITERGRGLLDSDVRPICTELLTEFPEFVEFVERTAAGRGGGSTRQESDSPLSPEEQLSEAYKTIRADVQDQLLDQLKSVDPAQFEKIVVDVLRNMGYGIDNDDATRITGGAGDGGIDGVIDEDVLGLDSIYVQAKRWHGQVGRPEVQAFAGALQGVNATRGVMIATSDFSAPAKEYARGLATSRIVLIDGRRLASLMFDHDVGVSVTNALIMKTMDTDYFSPDE